jgi:hypothetical protein
MSIAQPALHSELRPSRIEEAYAHIRLDRQGDPVSVGTLKLYEHTIGRFLRWLRSEHPQVRSFDELDVLPVREYRAQLAARPGLRGKPIQPETLAGSDRALRAFFRWATAEGYRSSPGSCSSGRCAFRARNRRCSTSPSSATSWPRATRGCPRKRWRCAF